MPGSPDSLIRDVTLGYFSVMGIALRQD